MEGFQAVQEAGGGLDGEDQLLTPIDLVSNVLDVLSICLQEPEMIEHIGPVEIGLLATVGVTTVKIRVSNQAMMFLAAIQQHCKVVHLGIAKDNEESLVEHMNAALHSNADIVLTSGGVSMGALLEKC